MFTDHFKAQGLSEADVKGQVSWWIGITSVMQNLGGFFGIYAYSYLTHYIGRKPAFSLSFIAAMASTAMVFAYLDDLQRTSG